LLTATRAFLTFTLILSAFAVLGGVGLAFTAIVAPDRLHMESLRVGPTSEGALIGALGLVMAAALLCVILGQLRRLVDTAIAGEPFVSENGRRLRRIAWCVLGMDVVTRVIGMGVAMAQFPRHAPFGFPLSLVGVLTVLMLLVLAHIFEYGTQLRAEVQGTV
jgi:hypothetical protein